MGYYINVRGQAKEDFLRTRGTLLPVAPEKHRVGDRVAVCLVDNGPFTAAAIAYSARELEDFKYPGDSRRKEWWTIPIDLAEQFMHGKKVE